MDRQNTHRIQRRTYHANIQINREKEIVTCQVHEAAPIYKKYKPDFNWEDWQFAVLRSDRCTIA